MRLMEWCIDLQGLGKMVGKTVGEVVGEVVGDVGGGFGSTIQRCCRR